VLTVSSNWDSPGDAVAIITVLQFPPSESFSILVNFESQYGTNYPHFVLSPRAFIQFANANNEVLIFAPSLSLIPVFSVAFPHSEPARSISESFPVKISFSIPAVLFLIFTTSYKIAWDQLDVWFAFVASVVLLLFPAIRSFMTYFVSSTQYSVTPAN